jgi:hypothetical protein
MGMTDLHRAGIAVLAGACCLAFGSAASAEEAEPVHLTYDVPAQCLGESAFLDQVAGNGGRLVQVSDDLPARSFLVQIGGTDPLSGRLVVRQADGTEATREVRDRDCDVVVQALALLVAMTLKPPQSARPDLTPPTPPPEDESQEEPLPPVPGLAAGPFPMEPSTSEDEATQLWVLRPHRWRVDLSAEGSVSTVALSSPDPGFAAYVELLDSSPSLFAPSIRLGAEISANQPNELANSVVRRFVGRLDACALRGELPVLGYDEAFTLEPCLRIDVGRLGVQYWLPSSGPSASQVAVTEQVQTARLWLAPAGLLRLRWTSRAVFVEVEGGVTVPLVRERFTGYGLDFTVPAIGATAGLGLGISVLDFRVSSGMNRTQAAR